MGSQGGLQGTRPAAAAVLGISPAAELSLLDSQMHTSNRSACHPYSNRVSATSRTAVYGPVRTVVWEGRSREAPPYPDCRPLNSSRVLAYEAQPWSVQQLACFEARRFDMRSP